jgi:hypothetical protein
MACCGRFVLIAIWIRLPILDVVVLIPQANLGRQRRKQIAQADE